VSRPALAIEWRLGYGDLVANDHQHSPVKYRVAAWPGLRGTEQQPAEKQ
jgi:hypothetical protein